MQKIERLIPCSDFVVHEFKNAPNGSDVLHTIVNYATFLQRELELCMFVPVMPNGIVPTEEEIKTFSGHPIAEDYQAAKERCLFEGAKFELLPNSTVNGAIWLADTQIVNTDVNYSRQYWHFETIEQLVNECEPLITPTALKEIYGI